MANAFDAGNAPEGVPSEIIKGDFIQWKESDLVIDYPSSLYTSTFIARPTSGGANEISVTATGSSSYYLFTITSTSSAAFAEAEYSWQLKIKRNSDNAQVVIRQGTVTVSEDVSSYTVTVPCLITT